MEIVLKAEKPPQMASLTTAELPGPPTKRHKPKVVVTGHSVFEKYAIPETLCKYVVTFFWDDPKTFGQWLQACRQNHILGLDKMTAFKVRWDDVRSLTLRKSVRRQVFRASFSKKLDLSENQVGYEECEQVASALATTTALKELNLFCDHLFFRILIRKAWKHFVFQQGSIKCTFPWGDVYEGEWKGGECHGHGKLTYASGGVYEGEWKDGKRHGQGKLTYARHGPGKQAFANGCRYEGEFQDGNIHGQGKLTFADGSVYEGEWKKGKKQGPGKMTFADGGRYEGGWKEGKFHGQGKLTNANGDVYEGGFKDGKKHGRGMKMCKILCSEVLLCYDEEGEMTYTNGNVYYNEWEKGKLLYGPDESELDEWTFHPRISRFALAFSQRKKICPGYNKNVFERLFTTPTRGRRNHNAETIVAMVNITKEEKIQFALEHKTKHWHKEQVSNVQRSTLKAKELMERVRNAESWDKKHYVLRSGLPILARNAVKNAERYFDVLGKVSTEEETKEIGNFWTAYSHERRRWTTAKHMGNGTNALAFESTNPAFLSFQNTVLCSTRPGGFLPKSLPLPDAMRKRRSWWKPIEKVTCIDPNTLPFRRTRCEFTDAFSAVAANNDHEGEFVSVVEAEMRHRIPCIPTMALPEAGADFVLSDGRHATVRFVVEAPSKRSTFGNGSWFKPYEEVSCMDPNSLPFPLQYKTLDANAEHVEVENVADPSEFRASMHADGSPTFVVEVDTWTETHVSKTRDDWLLSYEECTYLNNFFVPVDLPEKFDCSIDAATGANVWEIWTLRMDYIDRDETLFCQEETLRSRARRGGPLSAQMMRKRRRKLTAYFERKYHARHPFNTCILEEKVLVVSATDMPALLANHRAHDQRHFDRLAEIGKCMILEWRSTFEVRLGARVPYKVLEHIQRMEQRAARDRSQTHVTYRGWRLQKPKMKSSEGVHRFVSDRAYEAALHSSLSRIGQRFVLKWTNMFQVVPGKALPSKVRAYLEAHI